MMKFKYVDLYKIPKVLIPIWLIGIIPYCLFYLIYIICFCVVKGIIWLFTPVNLKNTEWALNVSRKANRHPHLIYKKGIMHNNFEYYQSVGFTSNPYTFGKKNIKLKKNPNPKSNKDSYVRNGIFELPKHTYKYNKKMKNWKLSSKRDMKIINKIIKNSNEL